MNVLSAGRKKIAAELESGPPPASIVVPHPAVLERYAE